MNNPKYFPEPEKFNPDRWNDRTGDNSLEPYVFLPFSAGPHNCIGQVKLFLLKKIFHFKQIP
jgi:cytochrome P450 family 9